MKRCDFIRLGLGASAITLVGNLPDFSGVRSDPMSGWAIRHRVTMKDRPDGLHMVARPSHSEFCSTLQELHDLADGPLHCSGKHITGAISGKTFQLELRATGSLS